MTARTAGRGLGIEDLATLARSGDRRAAGALRDRCRVEARQLASALSTDPRAVRRVVRGAERVALADAHRPYGVALVAAVQRAADEAAGRAGRTGPGLRTERERRSRAVGVLCDVQGHSHSAAARLLGLPLDEVAALHAEAREAVGVGSARSACRGWPLVARDDLTEPEQQAAGRHLALCRTCRDALTARAAARARLKAALPVGGGLLGGGLVAAVSALSGGAGAGSTGAAAVAAGVAIVGGGVVAPVAPPGLDRPPAVAAPADAADRAPAVSRAVGSPGSRTDRDGAPVTAPTDLLPASGSPASVVVRPAAPVDAGARRTVVPPAGPGPADRPLPVVAGDGTTSSRTGAARRATTGERAAEPDRAPRSDRGTRAERAARHDRAARPQRVGAAGRASAADGSGPRTPSRSRSARRAAAAPEQRPTPAADAPTPRRDTPKARPAGKAGREGAGGSRAGSRATRKDGADRAKQPRQKHEQKPKKHEQRPRKHEQKPKKHEQEQHDKSSNEQRHERKPKG